MSTSLSHHLIFQNKPRNVRPLSLHMKNYSVPNQPKGFFFWRRKQKSLITRVTIEGLRLEKPEGLKNILLQSGKSNINIVYMQSEDAAVEWNMNHEDVYRNNCYIN